MARPSIEHSKDTAPRAAALDLDGVLIDGMPCHIAAWDAAFAPHGLTIDPADFYLLEGISSREVVDRIAEQRGLDLPPDERAEIVATKRRRYQQIFEVTALPGATDLVATFADLGYRMALVTGTTSEAGNRALEELGVRDHFAYVVSGDDVESGKPAPDVYRRAAELLAVAPSHCLAVENAPAGVTSAVSAGLPCAAIATYIDSAMLTEAHRVFATVDLLTTWIREEAEASAAQGPFAF